MQLNWKGTLPKVSRTHPHNLGKRASRTETEPFPELQFNMEVRNLLELDQDDQVPGYSSYAARVRSMFRDTVFVKDEQHITESEEFSYCLHCPVAHPELCATEDEEILPSVHLICAIFLKLPSTWPV